MGIADDEPGRDFVEPTPTPRRVKRPYAQPTLSDFGRMHLSTQGSDGRGQDGGGEMTMMSDRRTKERIVRIGDHPLGIGLYLFDYRPEFRDGRGHGRQFGVMADEVETVMPDAVTILANGHRAVDYAKLGIRRIRH